MKTNKNFFIYVTKYLGIALIAGSVVHAGTLSSGFTRYIVLMAIGLVFMFFGNILEARMKGEKIDFKYLAVITGLSLMTGFLSGGIQHYLDNPSYAGLLLGIGLLGAYSTYSIKEHFSISTKNIVVVSCISLAIIIFSHYIMDDLILGENHHGTLPIQREHSH